MIDAYGWHHVFGEINNPPTGTNVSARVTATLQLSGGGSVNVTAYTMIDLVVKGQKSPFDIVLANTAQSSQVTGYTLSISTLTYSNTPYRSFANTSTTASVDDAGRYRIQGTLSNTGTIDATFVQVIATFYDLTGIVRYANWTYVDKINLTKAGTGDSSSSTFEVTASSKTAIQGY
ncbi:hypothetical protein KEJ39_05575, partial [Candidatus Bathyarchaeota archaeon]|nr:hypothetical protein [Candidatus Bathyarchaeota archaeon]